jgi:2-oxo-4-hydroxy-4-carboxy-5-ureidoimidazoline decarboxylase
MPVINFYGWVAGQSWQPPALRLAYCYSFFQGFTMHTPSPSAQVPVRLDTLNALSEVDFVALLGEVFEHSPWVAQRAYVARPFADVAALHAAMVRVVAMASPPEKTGLLRAHPELAGKAAQRGELTSASTQEQLRAGLNALSPQEMQEISALNAAYRARHGFPFIVCVGQHTKDSIFAVFARRAAQTTEAELPEALRQVDAIALLRLNALIHP